MKRNDEVYENEMIEHKIKIDDNTELRLKIPVELDAMEFTSILEKSRKVLKVSEISASPLSLRKPYRNNDQQNEVVKKFDACNDRTERLALAEEMGTTLTRLSARVGYYRRKDEPIGKRRNIKQRFDSMWSEEKVDKLKEMHKAGTTPTEMAKKLSLDRKQIYDKLAYMKKFKGWK